MRLTIEQNKDNSLWYVHADEWNRTKDAVISRGFKFDTTARDWADGFMDGYNTALTDIKALVRAHTGAVM